MFSSISDVPKYRDMCRQAAEDPETFARFREDPIYSWVVSCQVPHDAHDCYEILAARNFDFEFFDRIRDLDAIGGVTRKDYPHAGAVAPQTMRYVKTMNDLERLFGSLDGKSVIEIGVGFGGLCAVLSRRFRLARYTLVDLPEPLMLARRYLDALAIPDVTCADPASLAPTARYDLVISCYGLSEVARSHQIDYLQRVLQRAASGYLLWNSAQMRQVQDWHRQTFGNEQIHVEEMLGLLPDARLLEVDWLAIGEREYGTQAMVWGTR
ncbi:MAG: putative sugar O-methyltransferase [Alphaproteobacteria bacterium]|nr:putative sugar O-methyltransferase [Alphaproteobacteria bacterium]